MDIVQRNSQSVLSKGRKSNVNFPAMLLSSCKALNVHLIDIISLSTLNEGELHPIRGKVARQNTHSLPYVSHSSCSALKAFIPVANFHSYALCLYLNRFFSGNFLFIETSLPRRRGEKAWLYSPYLDQSPKGKCLNFWYHMYGSHIGSMNIYLDRAQGVPIWNRTGDQGNVWRHGRVNLQSYTRFRV